MKDKNITTKAQSEIISEEQMEDVLDLMIRSGTMLRCLRPILGIWVSITARS